MTLLLRDATLDGERATIGLEGGRIAFVERASGLEAEGDGEDGGGRDDVRFGPAEADRVIDASGLHAFPSLTNAHTHAAMTLFRGWGDDLPLMTWLEEHVWPAEEHMTAEDVYHGTRLALVEMIRSGTTHFNEMYWHVEQVARAVEELGVRAHLGAIFIDHGDEETAGHWRENVLRLLEARGDLPPRAELTLAPHAVYTVAPENLAWLGERAREEDLLLHIHLSETADEVRGCVEGHGLRPVPYLDDLGLLEARLVAVHGVHLDEEETRRLGEADATVVTCPTANMKLAVGGIFDYDLAREAGVRVALGTDGAGSNNDLDMIDEMKVAALAQKHRAGDARSLPAREALALATTSAARAFGPGSGRIEPGEPADLMLVDLTGPSGQPGHDPVSDLVYAASGCDVHTTICGGDVLMHDREVEVADEEEILAEARRAGRELVERAGGG